MNYVQICGIFTCSYKTLLSCLFHHNIFFLNKFFLSRYIMNYTTFRIHGDSQLRPASALRKPNKTSWSYCAYRVQSTHLMWGYTTDDTTYIPPNVYWDPTMHNYLGYKCFMLWIYMLVCLSSEYAFASENLLITMRLLWVNTWHFRQTSYHLMLTVLCEHRYCDTLFFAIALQTCKLIVLKKSFCFTFACGAVIIMNFK